MTGRESTQTTPSDGRSAVGESATRMTVRPASAPPSASTRWLLLGERFGLLSVLLITIGVFVIWRMDTFATAANLREIFTSQAVVAVLALGLMIPLVAGNFDLSVGSNAIICSVAASSAMAFHHWSLVPAMTLAICMGMGVGVVNGILVMRARVNGLIATLGTATILAALVQWYTNEISVTSGISQTLLDAGTKNVLGVPRLVVVAVVVALAVAYLLTMTPYGRQIVAIGSNERAARLVGVRTTRITLVSFVIAGGLAGLAGVLLLASQGSSNPSADGIGVLLPALVAVFLGASAFTPGQFNVPGTMAGLILIAVLVNGLTLAGVPVWIQPLANGIALLVGVGVSAALRKRRVGGDRV